MPKIWILFERQQKSIGGKKPKCKSKDDQAKHLQGWTTNPINANWKKKMFNSKKNNKGQANDVGVVNERRKIQGNTFTKHCNAQKWANAKRVLTNELP